jgi:hypothetical protein
MWDKEFRQTRSFGRVVVAGGRARGRRREGLKSRRQEQGKSEELKGQRPCFSRWSRPIGWRFFWSFSLSFSLDNEPEVEATFKIRLDAVVVASQTFHFNFNSQHLSIPAFLVLLPNVSKGTHMLKIHIPQDTQVDDKDHASMVVSWC